MYPNSHQIGNIVHILFEQPQPFGFTISKLQTHRTCSLSNHTRSMSLLSEIPRIWSEELAPLLLGVPERATMRSSRIDPSSVYRESSRS